jgi:hypothetical protein
LEHVTSVVARFGAPEVIGAVPEGYLANYYVTGGELLGPKITGKVLPVGGDWFTVRKDGVGVLNVRLTFETDDGALIYNHYYGSSYLGPDGYKHAIEGAEPSGDGLDLRTCPRFQTAHPDYQWLNTAFFLGIGRSYIDLNTVKYDIYQVH